MKHKKNKHTKKQKPELRRIVEYFAGGGAWFWSGYILIIWLDDVLGLFIANLIGNAVGLTLNFIIQRYVAFNENKNQDITKAGWRYGVYTLVNAFGLNYLILQGLKNVGIEPEIGQFIASGFFTVWNYFWYKKWVFVESK